MSTWHTCYLSHPLYQPIRRFAALLWLEQWPTQQDYDALLQQARVLQPSLPESLRFICDLVPEDYYELHIAHSGEVPTRSENWHDWFNALAWLAWPHSKQALNQRHVQAIAQGEQQRGPLRDAATLLDECGVLVAVSDDALGECLTHMQWQELFIEQRARWQQHIAVYALGHALFETGLAPYIGWCGKALMMPVPPAFFAWDELKQQQHLDQQLAQALQDQNYLSGTRQLYPLPLLGIPGWWEANQDPVFYQNQAYFRPTRRAKSSKLTA